jgi:hypothetical protein
MVSRLGERLARETPRLENSCVRQKRARGGRALLTGLMRCGRCGRMMRVFYGMGKGNAHRYQRRGDDAHVGAGLCVGSLTIKTNSIRPAGGQPTIVTFPGAYGGRQGDPRESSRPVMSRPLPTVVSRTR